MMPHAPRDYYTASAPSAGGSSWPTTMVFNTETRAPLVIGICALFATLTFCVLTLRLSARAFIVRSVGADDYIIILACLLTWANIITVIIASKHGLGRHVETVKPNDFITYQKAIFMSSVFYNACLGAIKCSVLTFYLRIGDRALRIASVIMLVVVFAQTIANVLTSILMCIPVQVFWDQTVKHAVCIDISSFWLANAATNILTDFLTYLLPMHLLWHLRVPFRQKLGLIVILGLGLFACVSSVVRLTYIPRTMNARDITWNVTDVLYWSVIESNIAILAVSIPAFKSIAKRYLPGLVGSYATGVTDEPSGGYHSGQTPSGGPYSHGRQLQSPFDQELTFLTEADPNGSSKTKAVHSTFPR